MSEKADLTPPELDLSSLGISAARVSAGETVEFTCRLTDDNGVKYAYIVFQNVDTGKMETVTLFGRGEGLWAGSFTPSAAHPSGEWRARNLATGDNLSNSISFIDLREPYVDDPVDLSAWDFVVVPDDRSLIIYTDGCGGAAFANQKSLAENGASTPAFVGTPSREGYIFTGWSPEVATVVDGDATYTAQWKVDDRPIYTVTLTDGCNGLVFTDINFQVREGDPIPEHAEDFYREGYQFVGWDTELATSVTSDLVYVAQWSPSADYVVAVDEGPIQIGVYNSGISNLINGVTWRTTNVSLGSISDQTWSVSDAGIAVTASFYPQEEGFATLYAVDSNGTRYLGSCTVLVTPSNKIDIATLDVSLVNDTAVYSPQGVTTEVIVENDGTMLTEGIDYVVDNNEFDSAGEKAIVVNGIGAYRGTVELHFTITAADFSKVEVASISSYSYTGKAIEPGIATTFEGAQLIAGTDFEVLYSDNVNVGMAKVLITGKGNYAGTNEVSFAIQKASAETVKPKLSLASWAIDENPNTPEASVEVGDYDSPTITYRPAKADDDAWTTSKPSALGRYEAKAEWAETANCDAVSATCEFSITLSNEHLLTSLEQEAFTYNGEAQLPEPSVFFVSVKS